MPMRTTWLALSVLGMGMGVVGLGGCSQPPATKPTGMSNQEVREKLEELEEKLEKAEASSEVVMIKVGESEIPASKIKPQRQEIPPPSASPKKKVSPEELRLQVKYLGVYMMMRNAQELKEQGKGQEALPMYIKARQDLELFPPGWQEAIINYRKKSCDDAIKELGGTLPVSSIKTKISASSVPAGTSQTTQEEEPLQDQYLNVYMLIRNGQEDEASGRWKDALEKYEQALPQVEKLVRERPSWGEPPIIAYRLKFLQDKIKELKEKIATEGDQAEDAQPSKEKDAPEKEALPAKE